MPAVTGTTYTLPATDVGWYITVQVRASFNNATVSTIAVSTNPVSASNNCSAQRLLQLAVTQVTQFHQRQLCKLRIKGLLVTNPGYTRLHCVGDVTGFCEERIDVEVGN